jgi:aryl-phospho-beta-D-glucosidase BglC (GH1 family)
MSTKICQRGNHEWAHWDTHGEAIRDGQTGCVGELKSVMNSNKKLEKTQKQLKELRDDFNKLWSERKETITKEVLWNKADRTRYEGGIEQRCGNLRKTNQTEILKKKFLKLDK